MNKKMKDMVILVQVHIKKKAIKNMEKNEYNKSQGSKRTSKYYNVGLRIKIKKSRNWKKNLKMKYKNKKMPLKIIIMNKQRNRAKRNLPNFNKK